MTVEKGGSLRALPIWLTLALLPWALTAGSDLSPGTERADMTLGLLNAFSLPLLGLAFFGSLPATGLSAQQEPWARYGLSRRPGQLKSVLGRLLALIVVYVALTGCALAYARTTADPRWGADLRATLPAVALAALSVGALFSAMALWLGRSAVVISLVLCWTMGHLDGPVAALVPVGHIRHLLGLGPSLGFPQWGSSLALGVFSLLALGFSWVRAPR